MQQIYALIEANNKIDEILKGQLDEMLEEFPMQDLNGNDMQYKFYAWNISLETGDLCLKFKHVQD